MNNVDKAFFNLIKKIDIMSEEEIFTNIKNNYLKIPDQTKESIESFFAKFDYWGKLNYKINEFDQISQKSNSLKNHIKDYLWLYQNLKDYKSRKLLYGILNNWYCYDFNTVNTCLTSPYKHYFDLDLIPYCDNEVLVDLGAYTGDTIEDYIYTYGKDSYKKIYCYDITDESFSKLKDNLSKYDNIIYKKKAVNDKNEVLYLEKNNTSDSANKASIKGENVLEATTLDDDIKDKITMIKMDIEGAEQKAILGSVNHIKNDTPKLLISVYHNNEDLWKIPKMIYEINNNYDFYLRCYGNCIYPTEIVLFALPKQDV